MKKKAEYKISSSVNEEIHEIILAGELTAGNIENLENEVTAIIKTNGVKNLLVNALALKSRLNYAEAYYLARNHPPEFYRINIAIVDRPENFEFRSFQEWTSINAGLRWKWFTDIDSAREWLKSKYRNDLLVKFLLDSTTSIYSA
jgi:hypothetical protein